MTQIDLTDAAPLSGVRRSDDGYLVAEARVARTGIQEYKRSELGMDGDGMIRLYRPEEEVFSADAMKTYAYRPVTINHPGQPVTADSWKDVSVGQTGAEIARDGEYVRVPMVLMDAAAIQAVESGARELSMGYSAQIEMQDGVTPDGQPYDAIQRGLRMNHLAIVAKARGGSKLRIGDDTTTAQEASMAENPKLRTVIVDGLSVETTDAGAQAIEKLTKQLTDASTAHDTAIAAKDADLAKRDAKITDLETKIVDAAALDKLVQDRATLIEDADKVAGAKVATAGLADAKIRKAAVTARLGDKAIEGKSDAYVEAMFDALRDGSVAPQKPDAFADGVRGGVKTQTQDGWSDKVFARAGVKMKKEG